MIVMSARLDPHGSEGTWWWQGCLALITIWISKPLGTDQIASLFVSVETLVKTFTSHENNRIFQSAICLKYMSIKKKSRTYATGCGVRPNNSTGGGRKIS